MFFVIKNIFILIWNLLYIKDKHSLIKSLNFNQLLLEPNVTSKYTIKQISEYLMIFSQTLIKLGDINYTLVTGIDSVSRNIDFNFDESVHFTIRLNNDIIMQYPKDINHDDNYLN